jgi:hypothetical protein
MRPHAARARACGRLMRAHAAAPCGAARPHAAAMRPRAAPCGLRACVHPPSPYGDALAADARCAAGVHHPVELRDRRQQPRRQPRRALRVQAARQREVGVDLGRPQRAGARGAPALGGRAAQRERRRFRRRRGARPRRVVQLHGVAHPPGAGAFGRRALHVAGSRSRPGLVRCRQRARAASRTLERAGRAAQGARKRASGGGASQRGRGRGRSRWAEIILRMACAPCVFAACRALSCTNTFAPAAALLAARAGSFAGPSRRCRAPPPPLPAPGRRPRARPAAQPPPAAAGLHALACGASAGARCGEAVPGGGMRRRRGGRKARAGLGGAGWRCPGGAWATVVQFKFGSRGAASQWLWKGLAKRSAGGRGPRRARGRPPAATAGQGERSRGHPRRRRNRNGAPVGLKTLGEGGGAAGQWAQEVGFYLQT